MGRQAKESVRYLLAFIGPARQSKGSRQVKVKVIVLGFFRLLLPPLSGQDNCARCLTDPVRKEFKTPKGMSRGVPLPHATPCGGLPRHSTCVKRATELSS